jgi:hypothetical protein
MNYDQVFPHLRTIIDNVGIIFPWKTYPGVSERFEEGSPSFLSIAALAPGLQLLQRLTLPAIAAHVGSLTRYTVAALRCLRHASGVPVVHLYVGFHRLCHIPCGKYFIKFAFAVST